MLEEIKVIEYESIGSTNAEAKAYAINAESYSPVLFIAREQSAGRGRLGRSFLSRSGRGIYMSLLYFVKGELCDAVSVTTRAAVVVACAIEKVTGKPMKIKWVNDIYNSRGKVAGILAKSLAVGDRRAIIVGVGINTGEDSFPPELEAIASSIGEVGDGERKEIISLVAKGLLSSESADFMAEYRKRFMLLSERVELFSAGESLGCGTVMGVSDDGGLMFCADGEDAPRIVRSGEISVRKTEKQTRE